MQYHFTQYHFKIAIIKRPNAGQDVEKGEPLYTVGGSEKLMQPLWKTAQKLLKQLKIELLYDPAIPLLSIYLKKMKKIFQKDTYCSNKILQSLKKKSVLTIKKKRKRYFKKIHTVQIRYYKALKKKQSFAGFFAKCTQIFIFWKEFHLLTCLNRTIL